MKTDATAVASDFYAAIEEAWNNADGPAFGAAFGDDLWFVDIRGVVHDGSPAQLGTAHQAIFDSIYKGSLIHYEVETTRPLGDDLILARGWGRCSILPGGRWPVSIARSTPSCWPAATVSGVRRCSTTRSSPADRWCEDLADGCGRGPLPAGG